MIFHQWCLSGGLAVPLPAEVEDGQGHIPMAASLILTTCQITKVGEKACLHSAIDESLLEVDGNDINPAKPKISFRHPGSDKLAGRCEHL